MKSLSYHVHYVLKILSHCGFYIKHSGINYEVCLNQNLISYV